MIIILYMASCETIEDPISNDIVNYNDTEFDIKSDKLIPAEYER